VWPFVLLAAAVIVGRLVDHALRRRLGGQFNSPWGEPEVTPAREGAGLILILVVVVGGTLLLRACPFPHIE
jgi:hypothetical protein